MAMKISGSCSFGSSVTESCFLSVLFSSLKSHPITTEEVNSADYGPDEMFPEDLED